MRDSLGELWGEWTNDGSTTVALTVALVVAGVLCIASSVVVSRTAARRWRSAYAWGLSVTVAGVAVAALGLIWTMSFHVFAVAGAAVSVLVAVCGRWLIDRSMTKCQQGHELARAWTHCPLCEPQSAAPPLAATPGGAAPAPPLVPSAGVRPPAGPAVGTMARSGPPPAAAGPPPRPVETGPVLLRLIPETAGASEASIYERGALLGRNPEADVILDDSSASWDHAQVIVRDGSPTVLDLGSSNGTFVNEERVESSMLINGDRLRLGDTTFKVVS